MLVVVSVEEVCIGPPAARWRARSHCSLALESRAPAVVTGLGSTDREDRAEGGFVGCCGGHGVKLRDGGAAGGGDGVETVWRGEASALLRVHPESNASQEADLAPACHSAREKGHPSASRQGHRCRCCCCCCCCCCLGLLEPRPAPTLALHGREISEFVVLLFLALAWCDGV